MYKIIHVIFTTNPLGYPESIWKGQAVYEGGIGWAKARKGMGAEYSDTTVKFYYTNGNPLWEASNPVRLLQRCDNYYAVYRQGIFSGKENLRFPVYYSLLL